MIIIPILLMPILGGVIGALSKKQYETHTTILIEEAARQNPFLEDMTVATNLKKRMAAVNALLHSNHMLMDVAINGGLINETTSNEDKQRIIDELSRSLNAQLVGEDLIKITYKSNSPDSMERILNLVSERFVERIVAPQRSTIYRSEEFLKRELEQRLVDLKQAETDLANYKAKYADELPDLYANNANRLSDLRQIHAERKRELNAAVASRDGLKTRLSQTNPIIGHIEEEIVQLITDLASLRTRYTDKHSQIITTTNRLENLKVERAELLKLMENIDINEIDSLWNRISSQSMHFDSGEQTLLMSQLQILQENNNKILFLEQELIDIEAEIGIVDSRISEFSEHEKRLTELERDMTTNRKIYDELSERYQKARITGALGRWEENERVKIIDPPFTPINPTNLSAVMFIIAGFFGGIALGCGCALMTELMDSTIRHQHATEKALDTAIVSRIPPVIISPIPNDNMPVQVT